MSHPHFPDPYDVGHDVGQHPGHGPLADSLETVHLGHGDEPPPLADDAQDFDGIDDAAGEIIGSPIHDAAFWQPQTTAFTCAVMAQRGVIEAMTGEDVSEAQLVYEATTTGCLSDGGMSPYDVGLLLDDHKVANHVVDHGTVADLVAELSLGHKVIVGVDSSELWDTASPLDDFFGQAADHAVWVTGVDDADPAHPKVIINDSGDPEGAGKVYDLDRFVDAWQDSGFFYVATDHAAPDYASECAAFDPALGHIPALASFFGQHTDGFGRRLEGLGGTPAGFAETPAIGGTTFADLDQSDRDARLREI